jgi:hypothetical protein
MSRTDQKAVVKLRGFRPGVIVGDNGMELRSHAIHRWQEKQPMLQQNGTAEGSTAVPKTNAQASHCSPASLRLGGSSQHGGWITIQNAPTRASTGSPQEPLQPASPMGRRRAGSIYERRPVGAGAIPIALSRRPSEALREAQCSRKRVARKPTKRRTSRERLAAEGKTAFLYLCRAARTWSKRTRHH